MEIQDRYIVAVDLGTSKIALTVAQVEGGMGLHVDRTAQVSPGRKLDRTAAGARAIEERLVNGGGREGFTCGVDGVGGEVDVHGSSFRRGGI